MLRSLRLFVISLIFLCALLGLTVAANAATITLTFEDLLDANLFLGGGQNIGTFYASLTFGTDVTGLSASRFGYNDLGYPSSSADTVIFSAFADTIEINFAASVSSLGFWFTTFDPLSVSLFGTANELLGSVTGNPNTDGVFGISEFLDFTSTAANISRATITSTPLLFVLDDLTYTTPDTAPIPEPGTLMLVACGLALVCLGRFRR